MATIPDTDVSFLQAGAGAVARILHNKLLEAYVSVLDFGAVGDGTTDDQLAFAAATMAAAAKGGGVIAPAVVQGYLLGDALTIPDGVELVVAGPIVATSTVGTIAMANAAIRFIGAGELRNVQLVLTGGSPRVLGLRASGYLPLSAVLIQGTGSYAGVLIDGFEISFANYGILRQGIGSTLTGLRILNGYLHDLAGDGIQLNQVSGDSDILIADIVIDHIDAGSGTDHPNWGMGIGVAGLGPYDSSFPDAATVKDVTISNVLLSRMRQGLHVEVGMRVAISDVVLVGIDESYSQFSGDPSGLVPCAHIAIYGSSNVTIDGFYCDGTAGEGGLVILCGGAVPNQNLTVRNGTLAQGGIQIEQGNDGKSTIVSDIDVYNGGVRVTGRTGLTVLDGVRIACGSGVALDLDMGGSQPSNAAVSELIIRGSTARGAAGAVSVTDNSASVTTKNYEAAIELPMGDQTNAIATGKAQLTTRAPFAMFVSEVRGSLAEAQTGDGSGGVFTVDYNNNGVSILSTCLTIDNDQRTSKSAAAPAVIANPLIADDDEITVDVDQIGDGTAKGFKGSLLGWRL